jgi:hypothetical protein
VRIKVDDLGAWIEGHDDFARLDLATGLVDDALDRALRHAGAGRWDGDHGWIHPHWIIDSVDDISPTWTEQFQSMIGFAAKHGWLNDDGDIRVHRHR